MRKSKESAFAQPSFALIGWKTPILEVAWGESVGFLSSDEGRIPLETVRISRMSPIIYATHIATLALWLSVGVAGTVGIIIPVSIDIIRSESSTDPFRNLPPTVLTEGRPEAGEAPSFSNEPVAPIPSQENPVFPSANEAPPEMPETAVASPLPELPAVRSAQQQRSTASAEPSRRTSSSGRRSQAAPGSGRSQSTGAASTPAGNPNRLVGARMPAPAYPNEARSRGQAGTVIVEFVVGENGRVISAYAKKPCPWPILNERAVRAVRTWRFPPGAMSTHTRPIIFKLN